jgi:Zn-dependent peptidase ImmA (M78 family)/predicted secreted protein
MPPRWVPPAQRAQAEASETALMTLLKLGVDLSRPIDIFRIIEDSQIWLMFQPVQRLYGAYIPVDSTYGIILNALHPLGLQRFTAAHEYGHFVLGHGASLDDQDQIEAGTGVVNEMAAQAFAANFLMPAELVNTSLKQLGYPLQPDRMGPADVYKLALHLGVTYPAAVTQLRAMHKISPSDAAVLRRVPTQRVKQEIGRGSRPSNPWADAWPVGVEANGQELRPRVDDEIRLHLPEMPATGYVWVLPEDVVQDERAESGIEPLADTYLGLLDDDFEPAMQDEEIVSAGGTRHFALRVRRPGRFSVRLSKRRRFQKSAAPLEEFAVMVDAEPKRTERENQGLSERQKVLLAA